ncbi:MerR family transcriptional regulator [Comamonas odontotermitis]|uniref:MerR family transcriptional regulator n=1 Tax=Comamonas TaxID=283 RepID=UPI001CC7F7B5|nr:MerR family DNA-binding transcriptional regulator [Comamonas odontotermitis]UBB17586.1 MerR family DNA-binding transcriptional regulator [Comamonas odontotermitis]
MGTTALTYTISDLAAEFDLTTRAIRFYEDMGLLHPDRAGASGKQRIYSAKDRTRLRLTLRAKRLGLSLQEAKEILDLYESPRDTQMQLNRFVQVLSAQRGRLLGQLADLQANLAEIDEHLREAQELLQMPAEKK